MRCGGLCANCKVAGERPASPGDAAFVASRQNRAFAADGCTALRPKPRGGVPRHVAKVVRDFRLILGRFCSAVFTGSQIFPARSSCISGENAQNWPNRGPVLGRPGLDNRGSDSIRFRTARWPRGLPGRATSSLHGGTPWHGCPIGSVCHFSR